MRRFHLKAAGANSRTEYAEKIFLTPEGNFTKAVCVSVLRRIINAWEPALRAYCTPRPGVSSMFDTLRKRGAKQTAETYSADWKYSGDRLDFLK